MRSYHEKPHESFPTIENQGSAAQSILQRFPLRKPNQDLLQTFPIEGGIKMEARTEIMQEVTPSRRKETKNITPDLELAKKFLASLDPLQQSLSSRLLMTKRTERTEA